MIKNCIIMLMVFTMTATAWCCGVRSINLVQAQNIAQQPPAQQVVNVSIQDPAPEPIPVPDTFAEIIKSKLGDFSVPGQDGEPGGENSTLNLERNLPAVEAVVDELQNSFTLPTFAGDTDASRELRNQKQLEIAQNLVPDLQESVIGFIDDANTEISRFADENGDLINSAPQSIIDSFFDQVENLHQEFFQDVVASVRQNLNNTVDPNTLTPNELPGGGTQQETTEEIAEIISGVNTDVPTAQAIINGLQFTQADFLKDFGFVRRSTIEEIENLQDITSNSTTNIDQQVSFDGALDSGFDTPTRQQIRFDVLNPVFLPGGSQSFDRGQSSIISMIQDLRDRFPGTALASDLQFFLDIFPPAAETAVQDTLDPGDNLFADNSTTLNDLNNVNIDQGDNGQIGDFDPNNSFSTSSFAIGLDGRLVGIDNSLPEDEQRLQRSDSVTRVVSDVSNISGDSRGFNSRRFGGSPGDFASVQITVGDRTYELYDHVFTSPIVLDMDGDGKLEASGGVYLPHVYKNGKIVEFDIDGDGFVDLTEWVGKNDGLLIQYDASKPVNSTQLFGDCDGFINGYEKLRSLDADENGKLSGQEIATLSVWQDKNQNAKVDAGEIQSLKELKITELFIEHDNFVSQFVMDGKELTMWDWYPSTFQVKKRK